MKWRLKKVPGVEKRRRRGDGGVGVDAERIAHWPTAFIGMKVGDDEGGRGKMF